MSINKEPIKTVDYTKEPNDNAMFLPSISSFYAKTQAGSFQLRNPLPEGLVNGLDSLDFLSKDKGLFRYKYALYSAGHAYLDEERGRKYEPMIWDRPDDTLLLSDSGGYQIASGILNFDWEGGPSSNKNNKIREDILRWQERISDIAMTLDIPTRAILNPKAASIKSYDDCLNWTLHNLKWTMDNQNVESNTRMLNVLQGLTWDGGDTKGGHQDGVKYWYDKVKEYNNVSKYGEKAFRGWAFAGRTMRDFATILRLMIIMRDENMLNERCNWIHMLGQTRIGAMIGFSAVQREMRKQLNDPNFTISSDSSSAFLCVANGKVYTNYKFDGTSFNYQIADMFDDKRLVGSEEPFPFQAHNTQISSRLSLGDICCDNKPQTPWVDENGNKVKGKKSSWDTLTYALLMNHNVEMMIKILNEANRLYKLPASTSKRIDGVNYRSKGSDFWIPSDLITFRDKIIPEVFQAEHPFKVIDGWLPELGGLGGQDAGKGLVMAHEDDDDIDIKESVLEALEKDDSIDANELIAEKTDGFVF